MGMWYAWARPDYLLWHMSIGMVIMYHNLAVREKYPDDKEGQETSFADMDPKELAAVREELRAKYGKIG